MDGYTPDSSKSCIIPGSHSRCYLETAYCSSYKRYNRYYCKWSYNTCPK